MRANRVLKIGAGVALAGATAAVIASRARRQRSASRVRKGVFIERALYETPAFVLRQLGIEWVLVESAIQKPDKENWITRDRAAIEKVDRTINPPDAPYRIELWAWGWPIPDRVEPFAEHVLEILASPVVAGYCLDIEAKSWSTRDLGQMRMDLLAHSLIGLVRNGSKKPLLLSSHGRADFAPLPWNALRRLDGALPQAYDPSNKYGDGFIARCVKSYREMGFSFVAPTLGASSRTSPARMVEVLSTLPAVPAVSWWSWTSIGRSPERQRAVRASTLRGTPRAVLHSL